MAGMAIGPFCSYPTFSPLLCCPAFVFPLTLVSSLEHASNDPLSPPKEPLSGCVVIHKQFLIHCEGAVFGGRHKADVQVTHLEGALLQMLVQGGTGPGCSTSSQKSSLVCHRTTGPGKGCSRYQGSGRTWPRSGLLWQMANRNISKGKSHPEDKSTPQGLQRGWMYQVEYG